MVQQTKPQLAFVAGTVRQAEFEQDRLQQRPPRTQSCARGQYHVELLVILRGQDLKQ